ncbi:MULTISPECIES: hypothetical protein [Chryseobacterium]|nr:MULTISPECIES: hypothetical protein [Chryseobacterium]
MSLRSTGFAVLFSMLGAQVNARRDTADIKSYADQVMIRAQY